MTLDQRQPPIAALGHMKRKAGNDQTEKASDDASLRQWRCLFPVTRFAEAEGAKGSKTRIWFNVKDQPVFGWGGLWRMSDEWGPVYSGAIMDCNEAIRPVHDRTPDEYDRWLNGRFEDIVAFQERCFPGAVIEMTRTTDAWNKPRVAAASDPV